jgi:hypothetical protein
MNPRVPLALAGFAAFALAGTLAFAAPSPSAAAAASPTAAVGTAAVGTASPGALGSPSPAAKAGPRPEEAPELVLGATLAQCFTWYGAPSRAYPLRGNEVWQDDVVLEYPQGFALYVNGDRVWQVGFGKAFKGSVRGVKIGMSAKDATAALGKVEFSKQDSLYFRLPEQGYPVRLRLVTPGGIVTEIHVYRADF